jgi:hypothetical protein
MSCILAPLRIPHKRGMDGASAAHVESAGVDVASFKAEGWQLSDDRDFETPWRTWQPAEVEVPMRPGAPSSSRRSAEYGSGELGMETRTRFGLAWRRRPFGAEAAGVAVVDSPNFRTQDIAVAFP